MKDSVEKARFYDLIIDRAKKELDSCSSPTCDTASLIFRLIPELNIDEDERIANEIIQFILLPHPQLVGKRNYVEWIDWIEKQCKQRSSAEDGKRPLHKLDYEGLTDFEKTLANVCVGWMDKKPNWRHYIKDSANILLKIATKTSDLIQDAPFEEKTADKIKPLYKPGDLIVPLNDDTCEVMGICGANKDKYILERVRDKILYQADIHTIDTTATLLTNHN